MKRLIAIFLCLTLVLVPVQTAKAPAGLVEIIVAMVVTAAAGTFIIYLYSTNHTVDRTLIPVVLQVSTDHITWFPVATNIIPINSGPTPAFSGLIDDWKDKYPAGVWFRGCWAGGTNYYNLQAFSTPLIAIHPPQ